MRCLGVNRGKTAKRTYKSRRPFGYVRGLPEADVMCYFWSMSTLSEIEAAVDALSPSDQESLLEHLSRKLGTRQPVAHESRAMRERWLRKLDQLRARRSTGKTAVPLQEVLDDIRSEPR